MAQVNMQQVKELRDRTQAGLNDCRSALAESDGDMDKAVEIILKKGLAKSVKRAGAVASEGIVTTLVAADKKSAVVVEVNIQTDFAARNDEFLAFVGNVAVAAAATPDGADISSAPYPGGSGTVEDHRAALVGRLGENITVRRWKRVSVPGDGVVVSYVHMGGKIAVLLGAATDSASTASQVTEFIENAAMQIAAMSPPYLQISDIPAADQEAQAAIFAAQLDEEGKVPAERRAQVAEGKVAKWAQEVCLLEQPSVLDPKKTVEQLRADAAAAAGGTVTLLPFVRFERGEGIEQPSAPSFADEVAAMASV